MAESSLAGGDVKLALNLVDSLNRYFPLFHVKVEIRPKEISSTVRVKSF